MKLSKLVLLTLLSAMMLAGCKAAETPVSTQAPETPDSTQDPFSDEDNVETWEKRPFYGELRFLVMRDDTDAPIPGAMLQISELPIVELQDEESIKSGHDGRIVVHQMVPGITYWGKGPPPPSFTFSAPHYRGETYTVEDLVSGSSTDPYGSADLPTTTFRNKAGAEIELPVYEFTIRLVPSD